jgi:hypothetical protein
MQDVFHLQGDGRWHGQGAIEHGAGTPWRASNKASSGVGTGSLRAPL